MIDELLEWKVKSRSVKDLGYRVHDINQEFEKLDVGISNIDSTVPNLFRARSLQKILHAEIKKAMRKSPSQKFDKLVLKEYISSMQAQLEFIDFFFTGKYTDKYGVDGMMSAVFVPEKIYNEDQEHLGGIAFVEDFVRDIDYRALKKREDLSYDMNCSQITFPPLEGYARMRRELATVRRVLGQYDIGMGFMTPEEVDRTDQAAREKEAEFMIELSLNEATLLSHAPSSVRRKVNGLSPKERKLVYNLIVSPGEFSSYADYTNIMELKESLFHFYLDNNGRINSFLGDLVRTAAHENHHRWQSRFSEFMPEGLTSGNKGYSLTGRTMIEGTAVYFEKQFVNWMSRRRKDFGISSKDIEIMRLMPSEHESNISMRLIQAIYQREEWVEGERNGQKILPYTTRMVNLTKNRMYADENYMADEGLAQTFYFAFYLFGRHYVSDTMRKLQDIEKVRLGNANSARAYIRRNMPTVMQGMFTGQWGWETHQEFFLKHYWPKARKHID